MLRLGEEGLIVGLWGDLPWLPWRGLVSVWGHQQVGPWPHLSLSLIRPRRKPWQRVSRRQTLAGHTTHLQGLLGRLGPRARPGGGGLPRGPCSAPDLPLEPQKTSEECRPPLGAPLTLLTAWCPRLSMWGRRGCQAQAPTGLPLPLPNTGHPGGFSQPPSATQRPTPMKWWQELWT